MVAQAQAWWGSLDEKQQKTIGGVACVLTATLLLVERLCAS